MSPSVKRGDSGPTRWWCESWRSYYKRSIERCLVQSAGPVSVGSGWDGG